MHNGPIVRSIEQNMFWNVTEHEKNIINRKTDKKRLSERERERGGKGQQRKRPYENRERVSRSFTGTKPKAEPVRCK